MWREEPCVTTSQHSMSAGAAPSLRHLPTPCLPACLPATQCGAAEGWLHLTSPSEGGPPADTVPESQSLSHVLLGAARLGRGISLGRGIDYQDWVTHGCGALGAGDFGGAVPRLRHPRRSGVLDRRGHRQRARTAGAYARSVGQRIDYQAGSSSASSCRRTLLWSACCRCEALWIAMTDATILGHTHTAGSTLVA